MCWHLNKLWLSLTGAVELFCARLFGHCVHGLGGPDFDLLVYDWRGRRYLIQQNGGNPIPEDS